MEWQMQMQRMQMHGKGSSSISGMGDIMGNAEHV